MFAAGNLLHGAETADVAALSGRHAAAAAAAFVRTGARLAGARVPIECEPPLRWIAPNARGACRAPPRRHAGASRFARATFARRARVEVAQGGRVLWSGRVARLVPGRSAGIPHAWTAAVDPGGGPVSVRLAAGG